MVEKPVSRIIHPALILQSPLQLRLKRKKINTGVVALSGIATMYVPLSWMSTVLPADQTVTVTRGFCMLCEPSVQACHLFCCIELFFWTYAKQKKKSESSADMHKESETSHPSVTTNTFSKSDKTNDETSKIDSNVESMEIDSNDDSMEIDSNVKPMEIDSNMESTENDSSVDCLQIDTIIESMENGSNAESTKINFNVESCQSVNA